MIRLATLFSVLAILFISNINGTSIQSKGEEELPRYRRFLFSKKTTTKKPEYDAIKSLLDPAIQRPADKRYQDFATLPTQGPQRYNIPIHKVTTKRPTPLFRATQQIEIRQKKTNYCLNNACQNNAKCVELSHSRSYLCLCKPGFIGKYCEDRSSRHQALTPEFNFNRGKSDFCTPNPCKNGGVCRSLTTTYYCECKVGYKGLNCDRIY
ncbi:hypothetical protein GJ496_009812 [Pomphorhynchus laevis]|nr:hypothetical protein GJ496_009812 [Pomphorhynchus laevis]